ncbi:hypothetical protein DM860_017242 [Cuscuta australis]|uniref:Uncharacterized protein n=1 Tax=Cuscuta australis TaxID=267555 RepID=A0A328E7B5_9ASTE|nr:hypothetical protein DM860_017242 [Cuscuta australis]
MVPDIGLSRYRPMSVTALTCAICCKSQLTPSHESQHSVEGVHVRSIWLGSSVMLFFKSSRASRSTGWHASTSNNNRVLKERYMMVAIMMKGTSFFWLRIPILVKRRKEKREEVFGSLELTGLGKNHELVWMIFT